MKTRLKNKTNTVTGKVICNECECDVMLGFMWNGRVYCSRKCKKKAKARG